MSERKEVLAKIAAARHELETTANNLKALENSAGDIGDISNEAFEELVAMLHKLSSDYCVETLAQAAVNYSDN